MFNRLPGIGLDIGSCKVRVVAIQREKAGLRIIKFGSMQTPAGMVEAGTIIDPAGLGTQIGVLIRRLNLTGKRVVIAVSGQQIYIRNLIMPCLKPDELRAAVYYQATTFLPIPVEEAALDIFPIRQFEDKGGRKTEVFFVAVRKQQVDDIVLTCQSAGLKPAVVEIEPLALYRAWGGDGTRVVALLAIGSARSYFTVFNKGIPVFYHSMAANNNAFCSSFTQPRSNVITMRGTTEGGGQYNYLLDELINEVKTARDYYELQDRSGNGEKSIEKILLCGGSAIRGLEAGLALGLGLEVELVAANTLQRLLLPVNISDAERLELQNDFSLALGLAARR